MFLNMATAYEWEGSSFTYIWIIENFSELTYIDLKSPLFVAPSISAKEMYLEINEYVDFCCFLRKEGDFKIDFEFSFLSADGFPLISKRNDENRCAVTLLTRASFLDRRDEFIPNDTLTVRCRMWKRGSEISAVDLCCARTKLNTYRRSFVWAVEEFGALPCSTATDFRELATDEKKIYPLEPCTNKGPFMALIVYLRQNFAFQDVFVEFLIEKGKDYAFSCELSVVDVNGKVIASQVERGRTYYAWTILKFWHLISKLKLTKNENVFLPNDTLLLRCSLEVCTGVISNEIEYCTPNVSPAFEEEEEILDFYVAEMNANDSLEFEECFVKELDGNDAMEKDRFGEEESGFICNSGSCVLSATLKYLHSDATLSDVSFRIGKELFPVHKNILCARCPAFKTIFDRDTTESIIEIKDMDESTLLQLLLYIYTDVVGDLQFEAVANLFRAAADYQLPNLRDKCSDFLKMNFLETNARFILSLARRYQDKNLELSSKEFVED